MFRAIRSDGRPIGRMTGNTEVACVFRTEHKLPFVTAVSTLAFEVPHGAGLALGLWLPKTPSELKTQRFRSFVRSWCYHDELSFRRPFRFGRLQFSNPCRPAGGDPRASSSTRGFPEERTAAFAPPAVRPAFVGLAVTMVARLAP